MDVGCKKEKKKKPMNRQKIVFPFALHFVFLFEGCYKKRKKYSKIGAQQQLQKLNSVAMKVRKKEHVPHSLFFLVVKNVMIFEFLIK